MTREEAIRIIGWLKCTTNREDDLEAIDMAIEALKEQEISNELQEYAYECGYEHFFHECQSCEHRRIGNKAQDWIPCSERLPKRDELVLVTYKTTDRIHLCRYLDDGSENPWWSYIDDCCAWNNVVLAWMPLPKPYRKDDET